LALQVQSRVVQPMLCGLGRNVADICLSGVLML